MALTTAQKLALKKHLGANPIDTILDPFIDTIEDEGSDYEEELTKAVKKCDTALTAIRTAQTEADELVEGGGARFNYNQRISIKKQQYREEVENLARIMGYPAPFSDGINLGAYL